jgi:hypothetical protein
MAEYCAFMFPLWLAEGNKFHFVLELARTGMFM